MLNHTKPYLAQVLAFYLAYFLTGVLSDITAPNIPRLAAVRKSRHLFGHLLLEHV